MIFRDFIILKKYAFIFILAFVKFHASAQTDSTKVIRIQEVVITSQRNPQQQVDIPYSVNSISRKEMDKFSPRTTPDALMNTNGVFVQMPEYLIPAVQKKYFFHVWNETTHEVRLMCSWDTTREDVDGLISAIKDEL